MTKTEGFVASLTENEAIITKVDRTRERISRQLLPEQVRIGDFVAQVDASHYRIDRELTEKREQELRRMSEGYLG